MTLLFCVQVHRLYSRGDYSGAMKASRQAQNWGMAAVMYGLCLFVLPIIMRLYFHSYHHVNVHYGSNHHYYDY